MAISKTAGIFGFLRRSVGGVTYSVGRDRYSRRFQIVRAKITDTTNNNTLPQVMQRMKIKPAHRFYSALNAAEGARLLEHSWQKLEYGKDGMREFLARALAADGPYIPKEVNRFIPAQYEIAAGSLPAPSVSVNGNIFRFAQSLVPASGTDSEKVRVALASMCGNDDTQVTFVWVSQEIDGTFVPHLERVTTSAASWAGIQFAPIAIDGNDLVADGPVAFTIILSRRAAAGAWMRSNATLLLTESLYNNIYGPTALQTAIESYQTETSLNSINNEYYLNLANGQAFPGILQLVPVTVVVNDNIMLTRTALVGYIATESNSLRSIVFTDGGDRNSFVYGLTLDEKFLSPYLTYAYNYINQGLADEVWPWNDQYAVQVGVPVQPVVESMLYNGRRWPSEQSAAIISNSITFELTGRNLNNIDDSLFYVKRGNDIIPFSRKSASVASTGELTESGYYYLVIEGYQLTYDVKFTYMG